jgi:hypothetical protein
MGVPKNTLRDNYNAKKDVRDNMGTNKHIKIHLKRPKKIALKRMLRI